MRSDDQPRLGHNAGVAHGAKSFMAKTAAIVMGAVMLVSAFVISLAFFVVALAVVLVVGGYLWWKTRDLRRQMREQLRQHDTTRPQHDHSSRADVIDGVVLSKRETRD